MMNVHFESVTPATSLLLLCAGLAAFITYAVLQRVIYFSFQSPFRSLRKPPLKGFLSPVLGHLGELQKGSASENQLRWSKEYGSVVVYKGLFCQERLFTTDPAALRHVLITKPYLYPKPVAIQSALQNFVGNGLLTAEGDTHRRQRKAVGKAFTASAVNQYSPLIHRSASMLVTALKENQGGVDVLHYCSRTTLDVIGQISLGQELESMDAKHDGDLVADSFTTMINQINTMTLFERVLLHFDHLRLFDPFRPLPTRINKTAGKCRAVCEGVANKSMGRMSVDEVEEGENLVTHLFRASKGSHQEKSSNSNSYNSQEGVLRDGEIVGQITTALLAGHETTSTALSWVLMAVAKDKELQQKLRDEINEQVLMGDLESMTPEQYDALPLLDNVTKETLRLYSPVHSTNREALEDDVISLSKPIINKNNRPVNELVVRKGQPIIIQIAAYNRSEDVWGPTAMDFNPDRWNDLPESVTDSKIPHGHLSFLAGARTCVGFRLAILEFKIILSHLLTRLDFTIDPQQSMTDKEVVVARPQVAGQEELGSRMPLYVSALFNNDEDKNYNNNNKTNINNNNTNIVD